MTIRPLERRRRVLIMGLGRFGGGVGAARFWAERGAEVTVTDTAPAESLAESLRQLEKYPLRLVLGRHEEADFRRADLVMVNPAVPFDHSLLGVARLSGAEIITEAGLAWRIATGPILAVTGTNGKSTTTAFLGAILQRHHPHALVGGNIGGSLLTALESHVPSAPIVMELSSFQLHYMTHQRPSPDVAVVTNLAPNHLDWHKTTLHYYESKRHLIHGQQPDAWLVLNHEDPALRLWAREAPARIIWTSPADPAAAAAAGDSPGGDESFPHACFVAPGDPAAGGPRFRIRLEGRESDLGPVSAWRPPGRHNVANALQALAAAAVFGVPRETLAASIPAFAGLPHRLEEVGRRGSVRYVNDSKATTPEAAILALDCFGAARIIALAGGYDKGADLGGLARALAERAHAVVLIGQTAGRLESGIALASSQRVPTRRADDLEEAFQLAVSLAAEASRDGAAAVVLLSPGCASWGMFAHYEARGDAFRRLAEEM